MLPVPFVKSLPMSGIRFAEKKDTVTCGTKTCHGAERPTLVLNYDVDTTKVTPVLHMQEVAARAWCELVWNEKAWYCDSLAGLSASVWLARNAKLQNYCGGGILSVCM
jgi:hypothetical protein